MKLLILYLAYSRWSTMLVIKKKAPSEDSDYWSQKGLLTFHLPYCTEEEAGPEL